MNKKILYIFFCFCLVFALCIGTNSSVYAAKDGHFVYRISAGKATITDVDENISGVAQIPKTLGGYPVDTIGSYAFDMCSYMKEVIIPDTVTHIGEFAFEGCSSLESIVVPDSVVTIGAGAFKSCKSLEEMVLPFIGAKIGGSGSNDAVFGYIFGFTVDTDKGVTMQRYNADNSGFDYFFIPPSLEKVVITGETEIPYGAFYNCQNLTSITIPEGTAHIGEYAFYGCDSLNSFTIPNSVLTVSGFAFRGCDSIKELTMPFVGAKRGVTNTTDSVLGYIFGYADDASDGGVLQQYSKIAQRYYYLPKNIEKITITDTSVIPHGAFYNCAKLSSVTLPEKLTNIGQDAFCGTAYYNNSANWEDGLLYYGKYLIGVSPDTTNVNIKDATILIAGGAFANCNKLTSLNVSADIKHIGAYAFENCNNLIVKGTKGSAIHGYSHINGVKFLSFDDEEKQYTYSIVNNEAVITGFDTEVKGSITIPETLGDYPVTAIGDNAFYGRNKLTSITLPKGVRTIGKRAFSDCTKLTAIHLDTNVTTIQSNAFENCKVLPAITIPDSVTYIGGYAFYNCASLNDITIGANVEEIGYKAFRNTGYYNNSANWKSNMLYCGKNLIGADNSISKCDVKAYTRVIAGGAFEDCRELTAITIPSSVLSVGDYAFLHCWRIKSVTIPDGVKIIGNYAFFDCSSLTEIQIPKSVKTIGNSAFLDCGKLTIKGIKGSEAETYANKNSITFKKTTDKDAISVSVNGKLLEFDQPPVADEGRVLVPLRAIFEALGASVSWDGDTQTVTSRKDDIKISLKLGSDEMFVNGKSKELDVPAKAINGRTLVPVRAISEALGCRVEWIQETQTVMIK